MVGFSRLSDWGILGLSTMNELPAIHHALQNHTLRRTCLKAAYRAGVDSRSCYDAVGYS